MNILHLNLNGDPAGVNYLLHNALIKNGFNSRHILTSMRCLHNIQQGYDVIAEQDANKAKELLDWADILHINQEINDPFNLGIFYPEKFLKKPFVFHNHGGYNLLYPELQLSTLNSYKKKFPFVVCSPLTKKIIPEAIWLPNICPINDPLYLPYERRFDKEVKICSKVFSTQTRLYKGINVVEEMINVFLKDKWKFPIEYKVFENLILLETLTKSADFHICVENLTQGFIGMAGWESLSKGQVVIARLDPIVKEHYERLGKNCPIIDVTGMDEMCKVIRDLCVDREYLKRKCEEGRKWMEKYYSEEIIVKKYVKLYEETIKNA